LTTGFVTRRFMSSGTPRATERRIIIVSDLHIIGDAPVDDQCHVWDGSDVFDSASELAGLIDWLDMTHAEESEADLELVLNGDSFDFPAEEPSNPLSGDPELAARRIEAAMDRVPQVCGALDRFLDSHKLTVIVGDRDTEMAVPRVRSRFVEVLGAREDAIRFVSDSEPCRIGRLWVEHGHGYDPWSIIDENGVKILRIMQCRDEHVQLTGSDLRRLCALLKGQVAGSRSTEAREDVYQVAAGKLLDREDVDLVVFGHTHQALRASLPGGVYMNTGTWARRLRVSEECLAGTESAMEKFGACIDSLLDGTFDDWISPQLHYADIRLTKSGEVESARLCKFKDSVGGADRSSQQ
jgi:UDP-2,3-diacylglucosamine pyrophosphatase LpxH